MANHKSRDFRVPSETKIFAIKFLEALLRNSYITPRGSFFLMWVDSTQSFGRVIT